MIDEREIWGCANMLIMRHGRDAGKVARERAEALLVEGQTEGHRTFRRMLKRIEALQVFPVAAETVH